MEVGILWLCPQWMRGSEKGRKSGTLGIDGFFISLFKLHAPVISKLSAAFFIRISNF